MVVVWCDSSVTDRPTDHATRPVPICRIYVCSTAMRPNNNNNNNNNNNDDNDDNNNNDMLNCKAVVFERKII